MGDVTGADVRGFFVVLAAAVVLIGGVMNIIKAWKDLRKPAASMSKWKDETDTKLANDNKRLGNLEQANKVLMQAQLAMLDHMITGNSDAKMRAAREALSEYLINRV